MLNIFRNVRNSGFIRRSSAEVKGRASPVVERLGQIFLVRLTVRTVQEMAQDDATHMAAGVAYYALFSLFPLLLGLIAVMTFFLDDPDVRLQFTRWVTGYLPGSEQLVTANLRAINSFRQALGIFAIIGLFWSGSGIFGAITRAVNRAWDVHEDRPIYISKPRQLLMALFTGVLFALSISSAAIVRAAGDLAALQVPAFQALVNTGSLVLLQVISFLLVLSIFLLIYKFLPNTTTYWRYIWPGALLGAALFELAKNLFIFYLNTFASFENVYGSLAPVVALLLWTYVSGLILILGAELSSEYGRLRRGLDRGSLVDRGEAA